MTLHSALEDLRSTTLSAISGSLRKLEYLARLRDRRGHYDHWGLARVHGEFAAAKALEQEHRLTAATVLTTPIQAFLEDMEQSSRMEQMTPVQYLTRLKQDTELLPPNPGRRIKGAP